MRSEKEMLDLILDTAREDERIRAVILSGSRANPDAPRDIFQDYDIVYFVVDVAPFRRNFHWIQGFGELIILQTPEDMGDPPPSGDGGYGYLMQFADGNRIDLGVYPLEKRDEILKDSLSILLLDKDGIIPQLPPSSERGYLPKPPDAKAFHDCCNEFWWICPYVAKGLWREEPTYAKHMLDLYLREMLMKMLAWYIGIWTDFMVNPGKMGKYFKRYLEPELWEMLLETYSDARLENTWKALFAACELFRTVALQVAAHFGFEYPHGDDGRVSSYLRHIRTLPRDAKQIY